MSQNQDSGQNASGQDSGQNPPPKIDVSYDIFNPGGDPSVLRACAVEWRAMAADLKATRDGLDTQVNGLGDAWTGAAATAFHKHWEHTRGQIDAALPNFETVAQQLEKAADSIEQVNSQIHEIVLQIAATAAIGIGLSIVTAGVSDAAAAAEGAAEAAEAGAAVARLARILKAIAEVLEKIKDAMEESKLLKFSVNFGKNLTANFGGNVLGQALAGQKVDWGTDLQDAGVSAWVGTKSGALGEDAATKVGPQLLKDILTGESESLTGSMLNNAITSAAGTEAADGVHLAEGDGTKTGDSFWQDPLTSAVGGLLGGAGVHLHAGGYSGQLESPIIGPVGANAGAYGIAGAGENGLTGEPDQQEPFDKGNPLVDPRGAYHS
ncbi:WXG100 family type VII secretion target [Kitasatospora acidiphila]|uniref:WXG100 family type VII secretion target n=1 Tax=Kitasatospora acidiphila TaxID=2567942 RepID=UPI003C71CD2A